MTTQSPTDFLCIMLLSTRWYLGPKIPTDMIVHFYSMIISQSMTSDEFTETKDRDQSSIMIL